MNVKLGVKKDLKQEIFNSVNENVKALESLFPSAVKDGQVDFKALKEELGQFEEVEKEKYELTWSGKQNAKKQAQQDILGKTLKYIPEDSKNPETTENLYIEGDNLEVLKLLRQNYYGLIKMIYIDPPYNTGNDFIYNDKFSMTKEESDMQDGTISELGERYTVNKDTSNRYHANWLNMMYPRLKVAKDLLTDDGVILISIDDHEVDNLRKICDEILGENNYISCFPRVTKKAGKSTEYIAKNNDYILIYSKSNTPKINLEKHTDSRFKFKDEYFDKRGFYKLNQTLDYNSLQYSDSLDYPITIDGETIYPGQSYEKYLERKSGKHARADWAWRWSRKLFDFGLDNGFIVVKRYQNYSRIYTKTYQNATIEKINNKFEIVYKERVKSISTLEFIDNEFSNDNSKKDLLSIFNVGVFDYSKPVCLLNKLEKYFLDNNDIILDFFSGSSSTAHAVMQLNAEDGGNRKFIMVQLPEETSEKSEAYKAGYKNICEIGKERIRRAGEKIKEENKDKEGIEDLDVGFKVFRVADTNIRWNYETVNSSTLDMFKNIENSFGEEVAAKAITPLEEEYYRNKDGVDFMPNSKDIDIVYEILLRQRDIHLSEKVELLNDIGERTYIFADSYLVCLEKTITKELIEKIASLDPLPIKFVFRDSAFEDNISLKDEAIRRLKALIDKNSEGNKVVYTVEFI